MSQIEEVKKFRKKPVVIEAIQWDGKPETFDKIKTMEGKVKDPFKMIVWHTFHGFLNIPTLEGDHTANIGDWIIRGVKGEFYPCKPDIFNLTYEPVFQLFEPKPDEGTLIKDTKVPVSIHPIAPFIDITDSLKNQRDLTASIRDNKWAALVLNLLRKIGVANSDTSPSIDVVLMAAEEAIEHFDKDAECQARVERLWRKIEELVNTYAFGDGSFIGFEDGLQALKKKEGIDG